MYKIKLKFLAIGIVAIFMTILSTSSIAYHTTLGKATNVITTNGITLRIHETTDNGLPFPESGVDIIPGDIVKKEVSIENVCNEPFYLRVKIIYGIDSEQLTATDCFKLDINTASWKLVDGWYYYIGTVQPGETTPNIFTNVEIVGSKVSSEYIGKTLLLTVNAQAVQSKNNPVVDNQTHTAFGWPQE